MNSRIRFVLCTAAVLTAGALSVWTAVGWLVKPPAGEAVSAGVISVPALLGQSAEEITFSPWTKYEMDDRIPMGIPMGPMEWEMHSTGTEQAEYWMNSPLKELHDLCEGVFQTVPDYDAVTEQAETSSDFMRLYLNGLAVDSGGKMLYFATEKAGGRGLFDFSLVLRGNPETEITDEARQSALDKVKEDLRGMILDLAGMPDLVPEQQLLQMTADPSAGNSLAQFLSALLQADSQYVLTGRLMDFLTGLIPYIGWTPQPGEELSALTLEEMISSMEFSSLQIVSLPSRILILVSDAGGGTTGIYYDPGLSMYSGIAIN